MNCSISDWSCVYHACMTDECQKKIVNDQGFNWGKGKCSKIKMMKAGELKIGQVYKLPGQRKWREIKSVKELIKHDHIPPIGRKVVIFFEAMAGNNFTIKGCKQTSLLANTEVILKDEMEASK